VPCDWAGCASPPQCDGRRGKGGHAQRESDGKGGEKMHHTSMSSRYSVLLPAGRVQRVSPQVPRGSTVATLESASAELKMHHEAMRRRHSGALVQRRCLAGRSAASWRACATPLVMFQTGTSTDISRHFGTLVQTKVNANTLPCLRSFASVWQNRVGAEVFGGREACEGQNVPGDVPSGWRGGSRCNERRASAADVTNATSKSMRDVRGRSPRAPEADEFVEPWNA
jgi:hypothetical protein